MCNQENSFTRKCVAGDTALNLLNAVTKILRDAGLNLSAFDRVTLSAVNAQVEPRIRAAACEASRNLLLTDQAGKPWREGDVAAPRINIQPTTARITCINGEGLWLAKALNIVENALNALFMEFIVLTE